MPKNLKKDLKPAGRSAFSLLILFCFFFSGMAGLIYQILWLRMIDKVVGSAPFAVATVLSIFMGGLALGSWLAGKYIDRVPSKNNLLSLYGWAELAIGIYGLLFPFLTYAVKPAYVVAYNALFAHFWVYRIFTFFGCSLLLIIPTAIMGVTLPVLCRFYVEDMGHIGARTGRLYGINTIGGAAGAVLCGFFLIANFGVWGSLATAVGINVMIGVLCISAAKKERAPVLSSAEKEKSAGKSKKGKRQREAAPGPRAFVPVDDRMIITLALWIFGISGFCAMAYEVFWTRLLGLIIGPTTYSFSLVVSTFIIGLAAGNIIFGRLADRVRETFRLLAITQVCAALLAILVSQFLGNGQFFFSKLIYAFQGDFGEKILVQSVVLFFILVGPTIFLGATFPLVNRIYARSLPEVGKTVGTAYAMNTIGAILGSFVAGFILIPLLGKENGLRITAGLQVFISLLALAYIVFRTGDRIRAAVTGAVTLLLGLLLLINFPSWNHNILARGWYYRNEEFAPYFSKTSWFEAIWKGASIIAEHVADTEVVFYGDGIGGFTTVQKTVSVIGRANYTMLNSGKMDASSRGDRLTQALSAHIPLLFHPDPEKVLVVGLASGMTAGEALLYPIEQLDVLEINDQVIEGAEIFTPWNNNCLTDPRTRMIIQDGRNHLELTRETYDVIISEPSNPWMAGLANLFTLDYFETVKGRLNRNGVFVQWFHSYDMDWDTFAMLGRTFAEVFPDGILMRTLSSDFLLIGFSGGRHMDPGVAGRNMVYARKSENITIKDPRVIFNLILTEDLEGLFGEGPFHTDNWPHLEFVTPKNLGRSDPTIGETIEKESRFSEETKEILEANIDVDAQLDNLELMVADSPPPFRDVDLDSATPAQMEKYREIVEEYCSEEDVDAYQIFPTPDFQEQCAELQTEKIREHLANSPEDSEAYMELGIGLFAQGKVEEAVRQFKQALEIDPDSVEIHNNLGLGLSVQGRASEAVTHYFEALRLEPENETALNNLGAISAEQGKFVEAVDYYTRAVKSRPGYADAHDNLGRVLVNQGRFEEAMVHFNEALRLDPKNADYHVDAGMALGQQGRIEASIDHFREALDINPDLFLANYNMAIVLSGQGKTEEALTYFLKASEIVPDDPSVHGMLGVTLGNLGRFEEAADHFSEVLRLTPDSPQAHDSLGVALVQLGRINEAVDHFKEALAIDSSYSPAREHLEIAVKTREEAGGR